MGLDYTTVKPDNDLCNFLETENDQKCLLS